MRATATATAAGLVRGLVRSVTTQRWPLGCRAGVVDTTTAIRKRTRGGAGARGGAAASVSSSTSRSTSGDLTKKFGDPSFWESQYSSQVCPAYEHAHTYVRPCNYTHM